jgi:Raf kinase inhibitor-like YbhB/YbcL family protein
MSARTTALSGIAIAALLAGCAGEGQQEQPAAKSAAASTCAPDNGGITLSPGFCASVFADNLGHVRHAVVDKNGVLYVNIWSGRYYAGQPVPDDGFLVALQDANHDGKADRIEHFGLTKAANNTGGSGIELYNGYVYAEAGDKTQPENTAAMIVRYKLPANGIAPAPDAKPEIVLTGLPMGGDHNMHPMVIDKKGAMFVDLGSATNSCQPRNRQAGVPGAEPCTESLMRAGVWKYDANELNQAFSPKERYATGLRNPEGLGFDAQGRLFAGVHGRDQLIQNWGSLYPDVQHTVELPAETMVEIRAGTDHGWPQCYYDGFQKKLVLAPEYGGDGGKAVGDCASKQPPVAAFPAHWAPNDLKFYTGKAFPKAAQGGAFIAFHGSWNRSPGPQDGFNVVFQPMKDGKANGDYVVFADGFAQGAKGPRAVYRPMAVAMAPDGAMFITDDVKGRIWRVTYHGAANAPMLPAPKPAEVAAAAPAASAAAAGGAVAMPAGMTAAQIAAGDKVFHSTSCAACHGADGKGSSVGPDLTDAKWLWGDGSPAAIAKVTSEGVATPKEYRQAMPANGGANLSAEDLANVSAYVWSLGHPGARPAAAPAPAPVVYPSPPPVEKEVTGDKLAIVLLQPKAGAKALAVTTPAFKSGEDIPFENTQYRTNTFPGLKWTAGPKGTKSYAIIMQDPDMNFRGNPVPHWSMYNIPATMTELKAGFTDLPKGAAYGANYAGPAHAYFGPRTPPGPKHRYHFQVFALDTTIPEDPKIDNTGLFAAMTGHVLASGETVGLGQQDPNPTAPPPAPRPRPAN